MTMQSEKRGGAQALLPVVQAAAAGLGLVLVLLLLGAILLSSGALPPGWLKVCPYIALAGGGICCGVCAARCPKRLYGALAGGLLMALILLALGFLFVQTDFSPVQAGLNLAILLAAAAAGSVAAALFR